MNVVALVLLIVAAVLFLVGGPYRTGPAWFNATNLGLTFLTFGLIVQLASKSHTVIF
jgi:hypothetical protein